MSQKPTYEELEQRVQALEKAATQHKRVEEYLINFQKVISSTQDGIAVLDSNYRYILVNKAYETYSGVKADSFIGRSIAEYLGERVFESTVKPQMDRCLQGECISYQDWFNYPILGKRWIEVTYFPYRDENDHIIAIVSNSRDITDRHQAQEALLHSEQKYRDLFESNLDAITLFRIDPNGNFATEFLDFNEASLTLGGYSKEEMKCLRPGDFEIGVTKDDIDKRLAKIESEGHAHFETVLRNKNGEIIPVEIKVQKILYEGKPALMNIARDIRFRKHFENSLRQSELRYRTLANSGQVLIWTSDSNTLCDYFNDPWLNFTGRTLEQELGKGWTQGVHPEDLDRGLQIYITAFDKQEKFSMEYRLQRHDGTYRWIIVEGSPRYDSQGEFLGYIGHCLDIDERKRVEEELRRSEERFVLAEKFGKLGNWEYDVVNNTIFWSAQAYNLFERDPKSGPPTADEEREYYSEEVITRLRSYAKQVIESGEPFENYEFSVNLASNRKSIFVGSMFPVIDAAGRVVKLIGNFQDITERKHAELELQDSEQRHRNYITNAPYGVFVTDEQGRYIQVNPSACLITGYNENELLTMSIPDLLFEETLAENMAHFHTLVRDGKSLCEIPFRQKSGERRWWSVTAVKVSDDRFLAFCNDITVRKTAEEALKFEKTMLARTEGIAHIGSWEWDVVTDTVIWSDELFRIFQRNPEEGSPSFAEHSALYHPDDLQSLKKAVDLAVTEGRPYKIELRAFRKDGEVRECVAQGFGEKARDGKVFRLFGSLQDITESKRMEQNYQMLFREMLDGFALHEIIVDDIGVPVNYRFLAVNPAFERMTGLKAMDIIGHTVLDIIPDIEMRWIETYGRVALTGKPVHFEDYAIALQKYFEITAYRPIPGQFACVFTDITEKKQAAREKQKFQVQLQQAQKMEAIGTLAGGIAHDFNNILGAILGYAEMVLEDSPEGSRTRGDIEQVVKASHRAKELVKQILNFSRQTATEQIPLHPHSIIKEVVKMLRSSLPSTIELQQDVDLDVGLIFADPTQINQILVNLCTNAFHAMEETGGILSISLKQTTLSKVDISSEPQVKPGNFVQLSVGDTGSGISPEIQQKMFDPFFTTKEVGKGTGMGLAIIHGIVKSYKGFISFYSQPGEGTIFHVYLPVIEDPAIIQSEPETLELPLLGNERILFIDDEEILAEMGKTMLERLGYRVSVRRNSIEALNTFQSHPDQFDLVITDQTMPGMTGSDLARRMLQIRPGMPIILCTGYSSVMSEEKARSLGIKGFAFKPLAKNDLAVLIRKVLDGEK